MPRAWILAACLLAVSSAGCLGDPEPVEHRVVAQGPDSQLAEPFEWFVQSQEEWAAFWSAHASGRVTEHQPPSIDFRSERVVAVGLGERPNGCWGVSMPSLVRQASVITAHYVLHAPAPGQACADVQVRPYVIVAFPQGTETVAFASRTSHEPAPAVEDAGMQEVETTTLAHGTSSGIHEPHEWVITDEASWHDYWQGHTSDGAQHPPHVDFSTSFVVAVSLGDQDDECHTVTVQQVLHQAAHHLVRYVVEPNDGTCTEAIVQPHHVVAVWGMAGDVTFEKRTTVGAGN